MPHFRAAGSAIVLLLVGLRFLFAAELPGTLHHTRVTLDFGYKMIVRDSLIPFEARPSLGGLKNNVRSFWVEKIAAGAGDCVFLMCRASVTNFDKRTNSSWDKMDTREYVQLYRTCSGGTTIEHLGTLLLPPEYSTHELLTDGDMNPIMTFRITQNGYYISDGVVRRYNLRTKRWDSDYASLGPYQMKVGSALKQMIWRSRDTGWNGSSITTIDGGRTMRAKSIAEFSVVQKFGDSILIHMGGALLRRKDRQIYFGSMGISSGGEYSWIDLGLGFSRPPSVNYKTHQVVEAGVYKSRETKIMPLGLGERIFYAMTDGSLLALETDYVNGSAVYRILASINFGATMDTLVSVPNRPLMFFPDGYDLQPRSSRKTLLLGRLTAYEPQKANEKWYEQGDTLDVWHYEPGNRYPSSMRWPPHNDGEFNTPVRLICPASLSEDVEVELGDGDTDTLYTWRGPGSLVYPRKRWHVYSWRYRIKRNGSWTPWSSKWLFRTGSMLYWSYLGGINNFYSDLYTTLVLSDSTLIRIYVNQGSDSSFYVSRDRGVQWDRVNCVGAHFNHVSFRDFFVPVRDQGFLAYSKESSDEHDTLLRFRMITLDGKVSHVLDRNIYSIISADNGDLYGTGKKCFLKSRDHGLTWDTVARPNNAATVVGFSPQGDVCYSYKNFNRVKGGVDTMAVFVDTASFSNVRYSVTSDAGSYYCFVDPVFLTDSLWYCFVIGDRYRFDIAKTTNAGKTWMKIPRPAALETYAEHDWDRTRMKLAKDSLIVISGTTSVASFDAENWIPIEYPSAKDGLWGIPRGALYTTANEYSTYELLDGAVGEIPFYQRLIRQARIHDSLGTLGDPPKYVVQRPDIAIKQSHGTLELPSDLRTSNLRIVVTDYLGKLIRELSVSGVSYVSDTDLGINEEGLFWVSLWASDGSVAPITIGLIR